MHVLFLEQYPLFLDDPPLPGLFLDEIRLFLDEIRLFLEKTASLFLVLFLVHGALLDL